MAKKTPVILAIAAALALAPAVAEATEDEASLLSANFSVAVMLLASVTYMMSTFMLVNHSDPDICKAAWQVMSGTISIFSAVLLFQGLNEVVAYYFNLEEAELGLKLTVNLIHAFFWYIFLQTLLAFISGAVSSSDFSGAATKQDEETDQEESEPETASGEGSEEDEEGSEKETEEKKLREVRLNMKCWAVLMGHVTGFACINAFGTLQLWVIGEEAMGQPTVANFVTTFVGGPLAAVVALQVINMVTDKIREAIALGDDGEEDEFEKIWDEETEETEDDVMGLTVSFTVVQILRFIIAGRMPNEEGEIEGVEMSYSTWQCCALCGAGFVWFGAHIVRATFCHDCLNERRNEQFKVVAGMVYSWCFFFSAQWAIHTMLTSQGLDDEAFATITAVVLALVLNIICYTKIFVLDKIADADWSNAEMDKSIRNLIDTVGILIGFAWEKAFDAAVVTTASEFTALPNCVTKLLLSIVVCSTVIPAWRWYILPKLMDMGMFDEEAEEGEEGEEGSAEEGKAVEKVKPAKGLAEPLLQNANAEEEAAKVRQQIEQFRAKSNARNAQLRDLKAQVDSHAEDAKKLPTQIKQVLDEVNRVKQTLN